MLESFPAPRLAHCAHDNSVSLAAHDDPVLSPVDSRTAVDAYLLECQARRLAKATIRDYSYALNKLVAISPTLPVSIDPIVQLQASQTFSSSESHRDLWRILKTFFKWTSRRYKIPNAMADIPGPKRDHLLPRTLDQAEIEHLLSTLYDQRDFAMIVLILDTGMRLGDVANLRWPHIEGNRLLLVHGKGGKQRRVYVRPETRAALEGLGSGDYIWVSNQPGVRFGRPIQRGGIQLAINRILRRAGFWPPKAGAHMLRHTYGRHFIRAGGSLPHLQRILGHSSVISTQIYISLNDEDLEEPQRSFSPIAGLVPSHWR